MAAEVFISYASQDRDRILDLVDRLGTAGVSVWIDQMGIEGATMWSQEIVAAIRGCKILILAISKHAAGSENVVKEVALASEGRKRILPVYLEQAEIPESMAYQLAGIQRVEFFKGQEDTALQPVIRALAKLGVTVHDEANGTASSSGSNVPRGPGYSGGHTEKKWESAIWLKAVGAIVSIVLLGMMGTLIFDSRPVTMPAPATLGTSQTNSDTHFILNTNRVVVLPFKVIGTANETADKGYGLVSTLTSKLQPLQNLVVIAKESARKFKNSEQSPNEIGQALGVGTIVTGEIQTGGGNIQVNIQLINANTEALGWGGTFTKTENEFLNLQNEIATQLARELKGGLDAAETQQLAQKATENLAAQTEYEIGRREWNRRTKEGFDKAIKHFERAIELDPDYADPYAGLADTYGLFPNYNFELPEIAMPKAKAYAEKAIEINPKMAAAYTSIAWVAHTYEFNWDSAEVNYKKAIQINPNHPTGHHWYGLYLVHTGRAQEGLPVLIKGTELDPASMIIKNGLSYAYWCAGKKETSLNKIDDVFKNDPFFPPGLNLKYGWLKADTSEKAVVLLENAISKYPRQPVIRKALFQVHWAAGRHEKAKDQLIELLDRYHDSFAKGHFAEMYFIMGKEDHAYRWLEEAFETKDSYLAILGGVPSLNKYQSQPRYRDLYKKINHPLYID